MKRVEGEDFLEGKKYQLVATGGTFDRFHAGHEALLKRAFEVGEKVIIGVTSDRMVAREHKVLSHVILPYQVRVSELVKFLKDLGFSGKEEICELNNTFGPTVLNERVEAIVCTRETHCGATLINKERVKQGVKPAQIVECSFVVSKDGRHISSTRIRLGQIDRSGILYSHLMFGTSLPQKFRAELAKPVGTLFGDIEDIILRYKNAFLLISVGDMVSASLRLLKHPAHIEVVDGKVNRKPFDSLRQDSGQAPSTSLRQAQGKLLRVNAQGKIFDFVVRNPAGKVTRSLRETIKRAISQWLVRRDTVRVKVLGEEDLAVLPVLVWAPLGTVVVYGQPSYSFGSSGVVAVEVSEEKKEWATEMLSHFD